VVRAAIIFALAACGRIAFERRDAAIDSNDDAAIESDAFVAVCGDGICSGNAGELCKQCGSDCATLADVCGNGECSTTEDSTSCYADCGPTPWPWIADDQALFNEINLARTGGTMCPGDSMPRFAPAFVADNSILPGAREYAWEIAHHDFAAPDASACNGRTFGDRATPYGAAGAMALIAVGVVAPASVVGAWKNSSTLCPQILMNTGMTGLATAIARDVKHSYTAWTK
jgi:hypothetical protein